MASRSNGRGPAPIVCGVDRSVGARAAARLSAALARRLSLPLVLVHAVSARSGRAAARRLLAEIERDLDLRDATLHVGLGRAPDVLLDVSEGAALVAVGGSGKPALCPGGRLRTVLARRARCPQLVVPPVRPLEGTTVVCGIRDWADVATAEVAVSLALPLGLELTLVHVLAGPGRGSASSVLGPPGDEEDAHRLLESVASAVGAAPTTRVAHGPAAQTLARLAAEHGAAALVIGAPVYGVVGSALAGSAASHLLRRTRRPLVVCPAAQRAAWPPVPAGSSSGSW
jgi:nucleotide-binding universal stress UspA family protein